MFQMNSERKNLEFEVNYLWIQFLIGANSLIEAKRQFSRLPVNIASSTTYQIRGIGKLVLEDHLDYPSAEHDFTEAIKYDPHDSNSYALRAFVKFRMDRPDESIIDLCKAEGLLSPLRFYDPIFYKKLRYEIERKHIAMLDVIGAWIGSILKFAFLFFKKPVAWMLSGVAIIGLCIHYAIPILEYFGIRSDSIIENLKRFIE